MQHELLILIDLTLVLLFAKGLEELMAFLKQPPILGDLLAGIVVGPTLLGLIRVAHNVAVIGWLGVVLLIFLAGLETDIEDLRRYGREAIVVAIGGVIATFSLALLVSTVFGHSWLTSLFIAVILAPTSVSVTVATLMDLGLLRSRVGEVILGAAVADDIYAMLLFAIVSSIISYGSIRIESILHIIAGLVIVFGGSIIVYKLSKSFIEKAVSRSRLTGSLHIYLFIIGLIMATLSAYFGLSPLVGAYFAGLALSKVAHSRHLHEFYSLLVHFISPFFFVYAGLLLDPWGLCLSSNTVYLISTVLAVVAAGVIGKVVGCGVAARIVGLDNRSSLAIGVGMMPRAGVDLVIAVVGLTTGVLSMDLYFSALVLIYITSLSTPFLLKQVLSKR